LNFSLLGPASVILIFWIIYGASENRVWKEHGEAWILGHFKTYHVLIGGLNLLLAWFGSGYGSDLLLFAFLLVYAPLALDVTWWLIRYADFRVDSVKAQASYGEPNAWHEVADWDNWFGLPLVLGVYWWWLVFTFVLVVLGVVMVME
jgi:hypothetical protein